MSGTLDLWRDALMTMAWVSAPFLLTALGVGLAVSLVQTATQLQESVLAFVPKLAAALLVIALGGNFVLDQLGRFATRAIGRGAVPPAERASGATGSGRDESIGAPSPTP